MNVIYRENILYFILFLLHFWYFMRKFCGDSSFKGFGIVIYLRVSNYEDHTFILEIKTLKIPTSPSKILSKSKKKRGNKLQNLSSTCHTNSLKKYRKEEVNYKIQLHHNYSIESNTQPPRRKVKPVEWYTRIECVQCSGQ